MFHSGLPALPLPLWRRVCGCVCLCVEGLCLLYMCVCVCMCIWVCMCVFGWLIGVRWRKLLSLINFQIICFFPVEVPSLIGVPAATSVPSSIASLNIGILAFNPANLSFMMYEEHLLRYGLAYRWSCLSWPQDSISSTHKSHPNSC